MTVGQILFELRATQKRMDERTKGLADERTMVNLNSRNKSGGTKTIKGILETKTQLKLFLRRRHDSRWSGVGLRSKGGQN
jgi:hypothetical protein